MSEPLYSKLYKAFLDDPTLSDLTLRLGDRSVYAHRIVLCRGSEYFAHMLTGRFKESASKEIELQDDDPAAMHALLRFLYDLPYTAEANAKWITSLKPHARVYVVADKYQIGALKEAVAENMRKVIADKSYTHRSGFLRYCKSFKNADDFFSALQTILKVTTTHDILARKVLMDCIIQNIDFFRKQDDLLSLLKEHPDLAAAIISHPDLESEAEDFWSCMDDSCATNITSCGNCKFLFEPHFLRRYRYDAVWQCPSCQSVAEPKCVECRTEISWVPESMCKSQDHEAEESRERELYVVDLVTGLSASAKANRWFAGR